MELDLLFYMLSSLFYVIGLILFTPVPYLYGKAEKILVIATCICVGMGIIFSCISLYIVCTTPIII